MGTTMSFASPKQKIGHDEFSNAAVSQFVGTGRPVVEIIQI
jgi:hypothetical protein